MTIDPVILLSVNNYAISHKCSYASFSIASPGPLSELLKSHMGHSQPREEAKPVYHCIKSLASLLNEVGWNISNSIGPYLQMEFTLPSGWLTVLLHVAINIFLFVLELI